MGSFRISALTISSSRVRGRLGIRRVNLRLLGTNHRDTKTQKSRHQESLMPAFLCLRVSVVIYLRGSVSRSHRSTDSCTHCSPGKCIPEAHQSHSMEYPKRHSTAWCKRPDRRSTLRSGACLYSDD